MSNPVTKFELRDFTPDAISKIMENFFDVVAWATNESIHVHHIQSITQDVGLITAGSSSDFTGLTWPQAFPTGITPIIALGFSSTAATAPGGISKCSAGVWNVTNTGCSLRVTNNGAGTLGSGILCVVTAIDPTFNTALA